MLTPTRKSYLIAFGIFLILLLTAYLPFINHTGYLQDDWDTLFITEQRGAGSLVDHFSIDRPLRGYFGLAEYRLFHTNMTEYQVAALTWRFLDTVFVFLILMFIWPKHFWANVLISSLVVLFPGFHEQTHALDYQAQLFSRLCMVASIYFSLLATKTKNAFIVLVEILIAVGLAQVSYGLMEYYLGMEALRFLLLFVLLNQQQMPKKRSWIFFPVFAVNAGAFFYWRFFVFQARRASVDAQSMFAGYTNFTQKIVEDIRALLVNLYRLLFSAYYEPLNVFSKTTPAGVLLIGIAIAIVVAFLVVFLLKKLAQLTQTETMAKKDAWAMILVGLIGSIGALVPIIFGGREITYVFTGDRFSYPGSITACIFIVGLLSLINFSTIKYLFSFGLIALALLTQFTNDYIFKLNYEQTNAVWWQLAWRAPQIEPTTLITGQIEYGINDEDYTFWGPANLIYYPGEKDLQITAEVLDGTTKQLFLSQRQDIYTRKTVTFDRDFSHLLVITKSADSCLHVIDGAHPEFSQGDRDYLQEVGLLSKLDRIEAASSYVPSPRVDLFGPEPEKGWCYYYELAQLDRQRGEWEKASELGQLAVQENLSPHDPMEWLVFAQAFAYADSPLYSQAREGILADPYTRSQACKVFSSYSAEMNITTYLAAQTQLLNDFCPGS